MRIRFFLLSVLAMIISVASANTAIRNAALARIQVTLGQLSPLIQTAEAAQDNHDPLQVNFQTLRHDLAQIESGIGAILQPTEFFPRMVTPLIGDYNDAAYKVAP